MVNNKPAQPLHDEVSSNAVLAHRLFHKLLVNPALSLVSQFVTILEGVLAKISRYDEGTLFSSFLSFTVRHIS